MASFELRNYSLNVTLKLHEYVDHLAHVQVMNDQIGALIFKLDELHAVLFARFFERLGAAQFRNS